MGGVGGKIRDLLPESFKRWLEEALSSRRKPCLREKNCSPFRITKPEAVAYFVSLMALTVAFSYVKVLPDVRLILVVLPTILATVVIVELVRMYALEVFARKKGIWTEHRLWYTGLALFIATTITLGVPFATPSRNIYHSPKMTKRLGGLVSTVAIFVTLAFAGFFFILLVSGFSLIGGTGLAMCIMMSLIDMFPVEPMYGKAIFDHKKSQWAALFLLTIAIYLAWLILI